MITTTTTSLRSDDKMEDLIRTDIELPTGDETHPVQRVHLFIGANSIHMSWKQFEIFVQKAVTAWDNENRRRAQRKKELSAMIDVEIGDAVMLDDKLGGS